MKVKDLIENLKSLSNNDDAEILVEIDDIKIKALETQKLSAHLQDIVVSFKKGTVILKGEYGK